MPAFTYLCDKVNISLAHKTMTIYLKNDEIVPLHSEVFGFYQMPVKQLIGRTHWEHDFFHDDSLDADMLHYHVEFQFNLTEENLAKALSALIVRDFITEKEKQGFLKAFKIANDSAWERFNTELTKLKHKAEQLDFKIYGTSATILTRLYKTLNSEADKYVKNRNPYTYKHFNSKSKRAIQEARFALEGGCTQLLSNVLFTISGLRAVCWLASTCRSRQTHGNRFFVEVFEHLERCEEAQGQLLRV